LTDEHGLYGIRRVGKTSILKELQRRLKKRKEVVPVYISLWNIAPKNVCSFTKNFTAEVLRSYGPVVSLKYKVSKLLESPSSILREILSDLEISAKTGEDIEFLLNFKEGDIDYDDLIKRSFALPEQLAKETKTRCVLMIDEFPSITDLKDGNGKIGEDIIGVIRTMYEDQENVILCVSGSIRKTMGNAALSSTSPFYRQFLVREIKPLEKDDVSKLIRKNLGKKVSVEVLDKISDLTKGIPFYVQLMGKKMELVRGSVNKDMINNIFKEVIEEEGDILFKEEFQSLSPKEQKIIMVMSRGISSPTEIANRANENPAVVSRYLGYLREKGSISKVDKGIYKINDPFFTRWVAERYELF